MSIKTYKIKQTFSPRNKEVIKLEQLCIYSNDTETRKWNSRHTHRRAIGFYREPSDTDPPGTVNEADLPGYFKDVNGAGPPESFKGLYNEEHTLGGTDKSLPQHLEMNL